MGHDIQLDGHEITIIKAMGIHGTEVTGDLLMERIPEMVSAELSDVLKGLIMQGYVEADKRSFYSEEDLRSTHFNVNSGYSRDLKEALDPRPKKKSRRVRRE